MASLLEASAPAAPPEDAPPEDAAPVDVHALLTQGEALLLKLEDCAAAPEDAPKCVELLDKAWAGVGRLGIFAARTVLDDVATADLRCALVPALRARALGRLRVDMAARLGLVRTVAAVRLEFLRLALRLGVCAPDAAMRRLLGHGDDPDEARAPTAAEARAATLGRYEAAKAAGDALAAARQTLKTRAAAKASADELDELRRDVVVAELAAATQAARDDAIGDERELEMLEAMAKRAGGGPAARPDAGGAAADKRVRPRAAPADADGAWLLGGGGGGGDPGGGIRVLRVGPGAAPGAPLAVKREQVRAGVFRPGHNLPTMTLDELADLEIAGAQERARKAAEAEARVPTIDEDTRRRDELAAADQEDDTDRWDADNVRRADESWARWKEDVKPGSGNKGSSQF